MTPPEPQVQELRRLLRFVFRGLWRRRGPPAELGQLLHRGEPRLGRRHMALLVQVGTEGPRTVGQLAEELGLSLPAASKLARDLEEHDLVYRHEAIEDKRRTVVDLNGQTVRHVEGWLHRRDEPLRKALATLDAGERDAFLKGLRALADELMRESPHGPVRPDDRAPRGRRPHRHRPV